MTKNDLRILISCFVLKLSFARSKPYVCLYNFGQILKKTLTFKPNLINDIDKSILLLTTGQIGFDLDLESKSIF